MATYKIKATMIIDVEYDIDAKSEDEAKSKFYATDAKDVIDDGIITDVNTENETAELSEGTFKIHVTSVHYDVGYSDCYDLVVEEHPGIDEDSDEFDELVYAKIDSVKKSLPQELDFEIDCEKEDLDDYVNERISDTTGWLTDSCEYKIISVE